RGPLLPADAAVRAGHGRPRRRARRGSGALRIALRDPGGVARQRTSVDATAAGLAPPFLLAKRTYVRFPLLDAARARLTRPAGRHARGARSPLGRGGRTVALRDALDLGGPRQLAARRAHRRRQSR